MPLDAIGSGEFDYIVVGGGSAGCIMASRLSERVSDRVLLIEAGRDHLPGDEPRGMADPAGQVFFQPEYFNPLIGEGASPGNGAPGGPVPIAQARVMGGGSSVNGMHAQRGEPSDYDEWRQLGVTGWGWDDVLPFFRKVEDDLDFRGPVHGTSGPVKIRRHGQESWSSLSVAVAQLLAQQGVPLIADLNDHEGDGYGPVPLNATEQRMSSATTYLTQEVRARKNLSIRSDTQVRRLVFDGTRVVGVEVTGSAGTIIRGSNVVVSCGAILSPELLLRSGIGPGDDLAEAAIPLVADRHGVGRNLQCHAMINVFAHLARAGRSNGAARAPCLMIARLSSKHPSCQPADLIFNLWERSPGSTVSNPMHRQFADFMLILNKPYSAGEIKLAPGALDGPAHVRTNLLSDWRDLDRMVAGFKYLAELASASELSGLVNDVFAMKPDPAALALFQDNWRARMITALGAMALGGPAGLRRRVLKDAITPIRELIEEPAILEAHVRRDTGPTHFGGTCRLGDRDAPDTVVDEHCRVVGVDGVRVVDASIFPRSMRAGTNLPTMMAAEKAASFMRQGH